MAFEIHVISKRDITQHKTVAVDLPLKPLAKSSIRVQSSLISLTANNLSYAKLGDVMNWWSTWPIPEGLPAPYDNRDKWGIVPVWGFARVLESNIGGIPPQTMLYGYWPSSSHPVDLALEPCQPHGHYTEISVHRNKLLSMYNRYIIFNGPQPQELRAWFAVAFAVWQAGYVLNKFNFPTEFPPVHPTGEGIGQWTRDDADLKSTLVVSLAASSKTGRSFAWNLVHNRDSTNGPLALLQASSSPDSLASTPRGSRFEVKTVNYENLTAKETVDWIVRLGPKRVVVTDFGGSVAALGHFREALLSALPESTRLLLVNVGGEPKVESSQESHAATEIRTKWNSVLLNTDSGILAGINAQGPEKYFKEAFLAFQKFLDEKAVGNLEMVWGGGIGGEHSFEDGWENLCKGELSARKAWVFQLL